MPIFSAFYSKMMVSIGAGLVLLVALMVGVANLPNYIPLNRRQNTQPPAQVVTQTATFDFSTFLGTPNSSGGEIWESVYDSCGNLVVVGVGDIDPAGYPGVPVTTFGVIDNSSIFVAKLTADASRLLWMVILGGTGEEKGGYGVGLDSGDNVYITGTTYTPDFPTTAGAFQPVYKGGGTGAEIFLTKISVDGSRLLFSTYLGGSQNEDSARGGLAIDQYGYVYIAGFTRSPDFLAGANRVNSYLGGAGDGVIVKVSPFGSQVVFVRFMGSPNDPLDPGYGDLMVGVQVDAQGIIYAQGIVRGPNAFTTPNAHDRTFNGGEADTYFAKLSADGQQILYATYFGGSDADWSEHRLVIDPVGNAYYAGATRSTDLPIMNGHQTVHHGSAIDAFLVKFNAAGGLDFSTYIGGSGAGEESMFGPAFDANGNVWVGGYTESADFEVTPDAYDPTFNGQRDVVLQQYTPAGQLRYSTYVGGAKFDRARFVAADVAGHPVLVGYTLSPTWPTSPGAYDRIFNNGDDLFVTRFKVSSIPDSPPMVGAIQGVGLGAVNRTYTFRAIINPVQAAMPITYTWRTAGQSPVTQVGALCSAAQFIWAVTGTKTITITAQNSLGVFTQTHTIDILNSLADLYLPLIIRIGPG